MIKSLCVAISLLLSFSGYAVAQERRAVTEDGKAIIVYPDNTWKYADERSDTQKVSIAMRGRTRTELPRSNDVLWIDESKWSASKKQGEPGRQMYTHTNGDGYAVAITERMEVPLATLKKIALDNARQSAPDLKVLSEETRRVNGLDVLCVRMTGTIQGIQFSYLNYYHSNGKGTIQLLTYTSKNLFDEYQREFTDFLSGLAMK